MKKKLRGVNRLLKTIGEPPLLNEDDFLLSYEAQLAEKQIDETKEEVLEKGFKFNTNPTVVLAPDINGYIVIPPSALFVNTNDEDLTIKEGMLYDRANNTLLFNESKTVTIVYNQDFDYIPSAIQEYILAKSSYIFQRDNINDPTSNNALEKALKEAEKELNIYKIKQAGVNIKDSKFNRDTNPTR